jgi:hypothetical protein
MDSQGLSHRVRKKHYQKERFQALKKWRNDKMEKKVQKKQMEMEIRKRLKSNRKIRQHTTDNLAGDSRGEKIQSFEFCF